MIRGEKINLRLVKETDLDILFDLWSDIENRGEYFPVFLMSQPQSRKEFEETGFWNEQKGTFLITDKEDRILGSIWYFKSVPYFDALEIGYILFEQSSRNQGCMSEALALFVRFVFETKKINRLQLTVFRGNAASKRVAEKCGFQSEGIARQAVFQKGKNMDVEWFALLREEVEQSSV